MAEGVFSESEHAIIGMHLILHENNRTDEFEYSQIRLNSMYNCGVRRIEDSPLHKELENGN